jgi:hypothetical protein
MRSYMYQPRRGADIPTEGNVARFGPDEPLRCPATILHKDARIVCGKGFGKMNSYGRAEVRVMDGQRSRLMHPAMYHKCKGCNAQLEITIRPLDPDTSAADK